MPRRRLRFQFTLEFELILVNKSASKPARDIPASEPTDPTAAFERMLQYSAEHSCSKLNGDGTPPRCLYGRWQQETTPEHPEGKLTLRWYVA
jgi:hypothetical protein